MNGPRPGIPRPKFHAPKHGKQAACWHVIRGLDGDFTVMDIAVLAECAESTAGHYIKALAGTGVLKLVKRARQTQSGSKPAVYRVARPMGDDPAIIRGEGGGRHAYIHEGEA